MNLRHLHHVVALADTLNFRKAAEQVHLSQPAFSRSIAAFEQEIGLRIFDRDGSTVAPTSVGQLLVLRARRLLLDAGSLSSELKLIRTAELGEVIFGAGPYPAASIVAPALRAFHARHPRISIRVEVKNWMQLLEMLHEGQVDFFIADSRALPTDEHIDVTPLGGLPIGFFCRPDHPLQPRTGASGAREVATQDLLAYPLASVRMPDIGRRELAASLGLPPATPLPLQIECDDITLLKQLVPGADIVLICANMLVAREIAAGDMVRLPIPNLAPAYGNWGIVKLAGRTLSPAARIMVDQLCGIMVEMAGGRPAGGP